MAIHAESAVRAFNHLKTARFVSLALTLGASITQPQDHPAKPAQQETVNLGTNRVQITLHASHAQRGSTAMAANAFATKAGTTHREDNYSASKVCTKTT